jgi:hypothetical protein
MLSLIPYLLALRYEAPAVIFVAWVQNEIRKMKRTTKFVYITKK